MGKEILENEKIGHGDLRLERDNRILDREKIISDAKNIVNKYFDMSKDSFNAKEIKERKAEVIKALDNKFTQERELKKFPSPEYAKIISSFSNPLYFKDYEKNRPEIEKVQNELMDLRNSSGLKQHDMKIDNKHLKAENEKIQIEYQKTLETPKYEDLFPELNAPDIYEKYAPIEDIPDVDFSEFPEPECYIEFPPDIDYGDIDESLLMIEPEIDSEMKSQQPEIEINVKDLTGDDRKDRPLIIENRESLNQTTEALLNEIKEERQTIIRDYVKDMHGGLSIEEQNKLSDQIEKAYSDKNFVSLSESILENDIKNISGQMERIILQKEESINDILCAYKDEGKIFDLYPEIYRAAYEEKTNLTPDEERTLKNFKELRDDCPNTSALFSDTRMTGLKRELELRTNYSNYEIELRELNRELTHNPEKNVIKAQMEALDNSLLEKKYPIAILNEILKEDISRSSFAYNPEISILDKKINQEEMKDPEYCRAVAENKILSVFDPRNQSLSIDDKIDIIVEERNNVKTIDKKIYDTLTDHDEKQLLIAKNQILDEVINKITVLDEEKWSDVCESANLVFFDKAKDDAILRMIDNKKENSEKELLGFKDDLKESLNKISKISSNQSLPIEIKEKELTKCLSAAKNNADKLEYKFFSDPMRSAVLAQSLKNLSTGKELNSQQTQIYNEFADMLKDFNKARGEEKSPMSYSNIIDRDWDNNSREEERQAYQRQIISKEKYKEYMSINESVFRSKNKELEEKTNQLLDIYKNSEEKYNNLKEDISIKNANQIFNQDLFKREIKNCVSEYIEFLEDYKCAIQGEDKIKEITEMQNKVISNVSDITGINIKHESRSDLPNLKEDYAKQFSEKYKIIEKEYSNFRLIKDEKDVDRIISSEKIGEFKNSTELYKTLQEEKERNILLIERTFNKNDLKVMKEAIKHNISCNVPGFEDYKNKIEQFNRDCDEKYAQITKPYVSKYISSLNDVQNSLSSYDKDNIEILRTAKEFNIKLNDGQRAELNEYSSLKAAEDKLKDILYSKYRIPEYSPDKDIEKKLDIRDKIIERSYNIDSIETAQQVLKEANIYMDLYCPYSDCKNIVLEKLSGNTPDEDSIEKLLIRSELEQSRNNCLTYLTENDALDSSLLTGHEYSSIFINNQYSTLIMEESKAEVKYINKEDISLTPLNSELSHTFEPIDIELDELKNHFKSIEPDRSQEIEPVEREYERDKTITKIISSKIQYLRSSSYIRLNQIKSKAYNKMAVKLDSLAQKIRN